MALPSTRPFQGERDQEQIERILHADDAAVSHVESQTLGGEKMGLARTHVGWENEHLATFLLSRVSFVASPVSVADDVGTDLFCTLFERVFHGETELLVPRSSLAAQVKSSRQCVDVTKQLDYLGRLEIPYYLGFIDQEALSLDLFSGRYLPLLLSYRGARIRLALVPVDKLGKQLIRDHGGGSYELECPRVVTLHARDGRAESQQKAELILADVAQGLKAVASRTSCEYIFDAPDGLRIFAGKDSVTTFRENFLARYAEALANLTWLYRNGRCVDEKEVDAYLSIFEMFVGVGPLPRYLSAMRDELLAARASQVAFS